MYIKQSGEEKLKELINEADKYFGKIKVLTIQEIRPEARMAS